MERRKQLRKRKRREGRGWGGISGEVNCPTMRRQFVIKMKTLDFILLELSIFSFFSNPEFYFLKTQAWSN